MHAPAGRPAATLKSTTRLLELLPAAERATRHERRNRAPAARQALYLADKCAMEASCGSSATLPLLRACLPSLAPPQSTIAGEKAPHDDEVPDGTLRLLRNVSGAFRPGVLTALMGASGAG